MSVSNATAINLARSEFRSLRAFFLLYILLSLLILGLLAGFYYTYEKEQMLSGWRLSLQQQSQSYLAALKFRHDHISRDYTYPRDARFQSAIYDIDRKLIFSTLNNPDTDLDRVIRLDKGYIQFVLQPEYYYLGAKYLVLEVKDDALWHQNALRTITITALGSILLLALLGWYIAKLFLRPMRRAIRLLDRFIKDTTHELNTPVTAILSNIETLQTLSLDPKTQKKINRIKIASRTLSTLYDDLTYLILHHNVASQDEKVDLSALLWERIDYFHLALEQKKITVTTAIEASVIHKIDRRKISRVIDNLISNAIKYNRIGGSIHFLLTPELLSIEDSGQGIAKEDIPLIFDRYMRLDKVTGGFGIGLNIVAKFAKEYGLTIDVTSELEKGTRIELKWSQDA